MVIFLITCHFICVHLFWSFSQFNMRCGREWVSVVPLTGSPLKLCGYQLPAPFEMTGGNITVTHHFLTHFYPVTGFRLSYIKGRVEHIEGKFSQFLPCHWTYLTGFICLSPTSPDSGPCFQGEFECYSERCLPASWRCNGRVECLGVGDELGSDEDGCDDVSPEPPIDDVNHLLPAETSTLMIPLSSTDVPPPKIPDFALLPQGGPCGGYLSAFYGSFTPPLQMGQPLLCVWTVDPQDSRPLKLELQQLELGPRDIIKITDQRHGSGNVIKTVSFTLYLWDDVACDWSMQINLFQSCFFKLLYHFKLWWYG